MYPIRAMGSEGARCPGFAPLGTVLPPSIELLSERRQRKPSLQVVDTFRIFNLEHPERNNILQKFRGYTPLRQDHRESLEWRDTPQPHHVKFIKTNPRFLNKPICYVDTEDTKAKEDHWWPCHSEPLVHRPKPPYDKKSTQRNDFQKPSCKLSRPIKYSRALLPSHGIVPLASPRTPTRFPKILQEEISFNHHYNARATPCILYQGKKQGAFVWREIKPVRRTLVPEGAETLTNTQGSKLLEQPQMEKGNSVENCMTSPCLCLPDSQETPDSGTGLSKTDISVGAAAGPSTPEEGQGSVGISQKNKVDLSSPAGEAPSCPGSETSLHKSQDRLPPLPTAEQSPGEIQRA